MKTVVYSCAFVPCEWIASHGLRPRRICPAVCPAGSAGPTFGVCPFVRAFIHSVCSSAEADAIVVTTLCDQMRRAPELIGERCRKPVFLMNLPSTWQDIAPVKLYVEELRRLGEFLVAIGGRAPSEAELADVMLQYDTLRGGIRAARGRLSAKQYTLSLLAAASGQPPDAGEANAPAGRRGPAVALLGGPLRRQDFDLFDLIEQAGGQVVLDATDSGERAQPAEFDRRRVRSQPLIELTEAYFCGIPHAFQRPNSRLYEYLRDEIAARGVRAIVFRRFPWCDTWNAEAQRLRQWSALPMLDLDVGSEGEDRCRRAGRVEALLESLS